MLRRLYIDPLLLFFLLSISALVLSFGTSLIDYEKNSNSELVRYIDPQNLLYLPDQEKFNDADSLFVYNPDYDLLYSTDGGSSFQNSGSKLALEDVHNPDLIYLPSSFHWKRPYGNFPESKSLVVRLKHKYRKIQTENFYINCLDTFPEELPVLALSLNLEDLISESDGILVFGEKSWNDNGFYKNWWNRNANFHERGDEWEKPVYMHYYEKGQLVYEDKCGLKISGNATRGFPQKSFQLRARKNYNNELFDYAFFDNEGNKKSKSLVVRNSGNDNTKTLFADLVMQRLAKGSNVVTQAGHPVVVYLNGNYWGIYNLRERIDTYYLAKKDDTKEEDITILEGGNASLKDGDEREKIRFDQLMEKLKSESGNKDELMTEVQNEIDLLSFTDYIIFETFYANSDWPENNSIFFREKGGKWKFILHDLDYGMAYTGDQVVESNLFDKLSQSESVIGCLFSFLMQDHIFKNQFNSRASEILETNLSIENMTREFRQVKELYQDEIQLHINRWRMIDSFSEWEKNCGKNLRFLLERPAGYKLQLNQLD